MRLEDTVLSERKGVATQRGLEELGDRLARIRKERGITQVEMAKKLGVSQPIISKYESGELRLHGELIVQFARILDVSADELLGLSERTPAQLPKDKRLLRRLQAIDKLSKRDRDALARTLDAFIAKVRVE